MRRALRVWENPNEFKDAANFIEQTFLSPDNPEGNA